MLNNGGGFGRFNTSHFNHTHPFHQQKNDFNLNSQPGFTCNPRHIYMGMPGFCQSNFQCKSPGSIAIKFPFNKRYIKDSLTISQNPNMPNKIFRPIPIPIPIPYPVKVKIPTPIGAEIKTPEPNPLMVNQFNNQSYPINLSPQPYPTQNNISVPMMINSVNASNFGSAKFYNNFDQPNFFPLQYTSQKFPAYPEYNSFNKPMIQNNLLIDQQYSHYPPFYQSQNNEYFHKQNPIIQPNHLTNGSNQNQFKFIKVSEQFIQNNKQQFYHAYNQVVHQPIFSPPIPEQFIPNNHHNFHHAYNQVAHQPILSPPIPEQFFPDNQPRFHHANNQVAHQLKVSSPIPGQFIPDNQPQFHHATNQFAHQPSILPSVQGEFLPNYHLALGPEPILHQLNKYYTPLSNQVIQHFRSNTTSQKIPSSISAKHFKYNYEEPSPATDYHAQVFEIPQNIRPTNEQSQLNNFHSIIQYEKFKNTSGPNPSNRVSGNVRKSNDLVYIGKNVDFVLPIDHEKNNKHFEKLGLVKWHSNPNPKRIQVQDLKEDMDKSNNFDGLKETSGFFNN